MMRFKLWTTLSFGYRLMALHRKKTLIVCTCELLVIIPSNKIHYNVFVLNNVLHVPIRMLKLLMCSV